MTFGDDIDAHTTEPTAVVAGLSYAERQGDPELAEGLTQEERDTLRATAVPRVAMSGYTTERTSVTTWIVKPETGDGPGARVARVGDWVELSVTGHAFSVAGARAIAIALRDATEFEP